MDVADSRIAKTPEICFFCKDNQSKYSCPRCNEHYCSLNCYRSEKHVECSESFYRDCITEELTGHQADEESKKKMMEILNKLHNEELQADENNVNENDSDYEDLEEEELDSDDEQCVDIEERMGNINLDDPEAVWNALTEDERNEFEALVSSGDVGKLVQDWEPWWEFRRESKLVEDVKINMEEEAALKLCPKIKLVAELTAISKTKPSECVKYNIMNVIASYAFIMRYFNGEANSTEFVSYLLSICGPLGKNRNFHDDETAVGSVGQECVNSALIETDETSLQIMKHDVYLILRGPSKENQLHYCNSALSDIYRLFSEAKQNMKKKADSSKQEPKVKQFAKKFPVHVEMHLPPMDFSEIKNCLRKIEYYLAYLKSHGLPISMRLTDEWQHHPNAPVFYVNSMHLDELVGAMSALPLNRAGYTELDGKHELFYIAASTGLHLAL